MVKKIGSKRFLWLPRHSKEVRVRLALGQSMLTIAEAFGCHRDTIKGHIEREQLVPADGMALVALVKEIESAKAIENLFDADPGSIQQARLRTALQQYVSSAQSDETMEEGDMNGHKEIGEMSDDELRVYVASLVPGLETKGLGGDEPPGDGVSLAISVSENGKARSKSAASGH